MTTNETELLTIPEIRAKLRAIDEATGHLKNARTMPPDSPYNRHITLYDLGLYLGYSVGAKVGVAGILRYHAQETPPASCPFDCGSVYSCVKKPVCREIGRPLHRRLSELVRKLDEGRLHKVRIGNTWRLQERSALAQMAPSSGPQAETRTLTGRVELTAAGPRLKI